jgi:hypothetical protein
VSSEAIRVLADASGGGARIPKVRPCEYPRGKLSAIRTIPMACFCRHREIHRDEEPAARFAPVAALHCGCAAQLLRVMHVASYREITYAAAIQGFADRTSIRIRNSGLERHGRSLSFVSLSR